MISERRDHPRYTNDHELSGREFKSFEYTNLEYKVDPVFQACAENISAGGLCIVSDQPILQSSLVCCQIRVSEIPVAVPVLMRVQWVQKISKGRKFRVGLKFLL